MFAKVLRNDMKHFDFQYKFGLNILEVELNTNSSIPVGPGGFYYCDIMKLGANIYRGDFVCIVEIPEDAIVIKVNDGYGEYFRTNKIILTSKVFRYDNPEHVSELLSINKEVRPYLPENNIGFRELN